MEEDIKRQVDNATRIICAKLYQGGLSSANSILNDIIKRPLVGKSPEYGIDIDLIEVEARKAVKYHLQYHILSAIFMFMGIISLSLYDKTLSWLATFSAIALITWKMLYLNRAEAVKKFSKLSYKSKIFSKYHSLDYESNRQDDQNVVIFGGYYPFLGAGTRTGYWDFVIDTSKPSKTLTLESLEPIEISIKELYEDASKKLSSIGLPNVYDRWILFADGNELEKKFLRPRKPDDPIDFTDLDSAVFFSPEHKNYLEQVVGEPIENLGPQELFSDGHGDLSNEYRAYYTIRYFDKARGTLFSTFLRFSRVGKKIFAECSFYFLPPIDENRYDIDKIPLFDELFIYRRGLMTVAVVLALIILSQMDSMIYFLTILIFSLSIFLPIISFINGPYAKYGIKKWLKQNAQFVWHVLQLFYERGTPINYGNLATFREIAASPTHKNYYNSQDTLLIKNSIEKTIVDSIAELLDSKNIDSCFLREGLQSVVNQGVIMYGGNLEAEQVAVGKGAKTLINKLPKRLVRSSKWLSRKVGERNEL